jgi:MFS family permease
VQSERSPRAVLGLVFLTVFIDLVGFSILFPLFPELLSHYLASEGPDSAVGRLVSGLRRWIGERQGADIAVTALFGGLLGSLYSGLQFLAAPLWGALSDRIGRRPALLVTLAGTALAYALWSLAASFLWLVVSRILAGIMAGNIATASAVVADVSPREQRGRNMAVIGIAIGLGFVLGPAIGGLAFAYGPTLGDSLDSFGWHRFSFPALIAFGLAAVNLLWALARFPETRRAETSGEERRPLRPFQALRAINQPGVTRTHAIYLAYSTAFAAMEFTLVFLAAERLGYKPQQNAWMFVFIGLVIALTQGGLVRRLAPKLGERKLVRVGLLLLLPGFLLVGLAHSTPVLYAGLLLLALGSALEMPCLSALVSLYAPAERQGLALGTFRSMGALSRAIGPLLGAGLYWAVSPTTPYVVGAVALLWPLWMSLSLPEPRHGGR